MGQKVVDFLGGLLGVGGKRGTNEPSEQSKGSPGSAEPHAAERDKGSIGGTGKYQLKLRRAGAGMSPPARDLVPAGDSHPNFKGAQQFFKEGRAPNN